MDIDDLIDLTDRKMLPEKELRRRAGRDRRRLNRLTRGEAKAANRLRQAELRNAPDQLPHPKT